jgi:hypothetical protein
MAFSLVWPRRGNTAKSAPRIASRPGRCVIGGLERIRSRASGHPFERGSRPSPTASAKNSSRASKMNFPASSQMVSCEHSSAGSGNGDRPPRGSLSSRPHKMMPRKSFMKSCPRARRSRRVGALFHWALQRSGISPGASAPGGAPALVVQERSQGRCLWTTSLVSLLSCRDIGAPRVAFCFTPTAGVRMRVRITKRSSRPMASRAA